MPEVAVFTVFDGLQLPVKPCCELDGKTGALAPMQSVVGRPTNKGFCVAGLIVTLRLIGEAHCPGLGVNV